MHVNIDTLSITGKLTLAQSLFTDTRSLATSLITPFLSFEVDTSQGSQFFTVGRERGRINYFEHSYEILFDGDKVGHISFGGNVDNQRRESWQLYLGSSACAVISLQKQYKHIKRTIIELEDCRLSRVDLALDDIEGRTSIEGAMRSYVNGEFNPETGRPPKCKLIGNPFDPNDKEGRTFYVGRRDALKVSRTYEKGKQLGYADSPWIRWEVEFKRDKYAEIPVDILTTPATYFRGSYPVMATLIDCSSDYRRIIREAIKIKLEAALYHARRSYGKWLHLARESGYCVASEVIDGFENEIPRRLLSEAYLSGVIQATPRSNTGVN